MVDLAKDLRTEHIILQMGPSHPAVHGIVKLMTEVDGETVIKADPGIGYLHRGFEKESENHTYTQVIPYTDRLNYVSSMINNVGYVMAVEKLLGVEVTERCKYIRVIACEISRIADHLTCLGMVATELAAMTVFFYFMQAREWVWELIEDMCGARLTTTYTRIGGLAYDLPEGFAEKTKEALAKFREKYDDVYALLIRNRIFYDRVRDVGVVSAEDAIAWGFAGPVLRSTGVNYDVRKAKPYLVYDQMDFEIPLGTNGDNYDRFVVRMEEMLQSVRIIEQALEKIPDGPVNIDDPKIVLPEKEKVYNSIEGLIHHFKWVVDGIQPPKGEVYVCVEGANGELGFYIVSDGSNKPYKCRVRPPCFLLTQGLPLMIEGGMIADIIPSFGLINMIGGELER